MGVSGLAVMIIVPSGSCSLFGMFIGAACLLVVPGEYLVGGSIGTHCAVAWVGLSWFRLSVYLAIGVTGLPWFWLAVYRGIGATGTSWFWLVVYCFAGPIDSHRAILAIRLLKLAVSLSSRVLLLFVSSLSLLWFDNMSVVSLKKSRAS